MSASEPTLRSGSQLMGDTVFQTECNLMTLREPARGLNPSGNCPADDGTAYIYCLSHQVSFTVARGTRPIICQLRGEVIGNGWSADEGWVFCCDCERFARLINTNTRVTACPACERVWQQYYLCDRCRVLSAMADERNDERAFVLTATGPHPACPGCLTKAPESLLSHKCVRLGVTLQTKRTMCPFCLNEIQQGLFPFLPVSFAEEATGGYHQLEKGEIKIQRAVPLSPQMIAETDAIASAPDSTPTSPELPSDSAATGFKPQKQPKSFRRFRAGWVAVMVLTLLLLVFVAAINLGKKRPSQAASAAATTLSKSPSTSPTVASNSEQEPQRDPQTELEAEQQRAVEEIRRLLRKNGK